ncbi:2-oxo acid dehydrogenase subunit E2 [Actinospica durhamensis]|uniref:Dihydrolipoamide acetyltransferase component of pyruvate dehydrogenase complex n=1 Tax=Actinospica durhamensis TaxID=1508375 RepID=A0A941IU30_9ACTN|nr:dihydrolipoamide acetyltransferase family protein [Actinospica durhamensis]MBR7836818.1 2-oxo acid dehydrogenase subunit E2 [Actinospica durhamensis]
MTATATQRAQLFRLPDLGEGLTEAEILAWRVEVGDTVEIDQIVVEVETAKAAVEVPIPYEGTVLTLHCEAGTVLDVGAPLISIAAGSVEDAVVEDAVADEAAVYDAVTDEAAADDRYREEERAGSGNVLIGYGTGHAPATRRRNRVKARATAPQPEPAAASAPQSPDSIKPPRVISPVVRKLARDNGSDLHRLQPSGPGGVIRRADVAAAIDQAQQPAAVPVAASPVIVEGIERIPLRGMRRAVAEKLTRSRSEIPDATTWVDVDATELLNTKAALQAAFPDRPVGLLALLARICVAGLERFPDLNASVDTARGEILRYRHVNLGFAAQTERGLVVPVIHGAHRLTTARLHAEAARLTALARAGQIPPAALTGGTFTLNNYGVFGVDGSTPIINHPEAAILGIGRIIDKPWVVAGQLAVRKVTQLSLTFDHRVCDGGVAGGFLRYIADRVESPATLLADL